MHTRIRRLLTMLPCAAAFAVAAPAQTPAAPVDVGRALQRMADSIVAARPKLPGLIIAVESTTTGRGWQVAAGVADVASRAPLSPGQPVRLASNTKTYVAAAVLRLVEQGRLSLSDPIRKYLPSTLDSLLRSDGYRTDLITIEQVLSHRAGFAEHPSVPSYVKMLQTDPQHHWTREEQVRWLVDSLAPVGPPGAQFHYSDTGYLLLGRIIEERTGQSLATAVRSLVDLRRRGLRHTWWEVLESPPRGVAPRAHQYIGGADMSAVDASFDLYGGGGLVASMGDLAHFHAQLLGGHVLAQRATLDTMRFVRSTAPMAYALGLYTTTVSGVRGLGHAGFWGTTAVTFPERGVTIAVAVTEQGEARQMTAVMAAVLAILAVPAGAPH